MVRGMFRSFTISLLAGVLGALTLQGCATLPVADGIPGRIVDGIHDGGRSVPSRPKGSGWAIGIDEGGPHEGGPEVDPAEPIDGAPLYW